MSFKKKGQKIENIFGTKTRSNQKLKKKTLKNNPRLYLYRQILMTAPKFFNINQKDNSKREKKKLFKKATQDIVLGGQWILTGATFTTLNLMEIS